MHIHSYSEDPTQVILVCKTLIGDEVYGTPVRSQMIVVIGDGYK